MVSTILPDSAPYAAQGMTYTEVGEPRLTLAEQFRLVEIAHETTDAGVKRAALGLLNKTLNPPMIFTKEI